MIDGGNFLEITNESGIYCIHCPDSDAWYIGKAVNIKRRKETHLQTLKNHSHVNGRLQALYDKHGKESLFFYAVEYCQVSDLISREQSWYDHFRLTLNRAMLNYGDSVMQVGNRSNHPSRLGQPLKPDGKKRTERRSFNFTEDDEQKLIAIVTRPIPQPSRL